MTHDLRAFAAPTRSTHPPRPARHLRHVRDDALAGQRDRRSPSSSAAATPSTRPSPAAFVLHVVEPHLNGPGGDISGARQRGGRRRRPAGARRPGTRARRRATIEHYRAEGLDLVPGAGGARGRRARRGRRLAAAAARPRHLGAGRRLAYVLGYAERRLPPRRARRGDGRVGARALRAALADLGRLLARRRGAPAHRHAHDQPGVRGGAARAARRRGGRRRRREDRIEAARDRVGDRRRPAGGLARCSPGRTGTPTAPTTPA